jgi:hypothetical protein
VIAGPAGPAGPRQVPLLLLFRSVAAVVDVLVAVAALVGLA